MGKRLCNLLSTMSAELNVSSLEAIVGTALRPEKILLNIQCGGNLTLLGLHKRVPTADVVTSDTQFKYATKLA